MAIIQHNTPIRRMRLIPDLKIHSFHLQIVFHLPLICIMILIFLLVLTYMHNLQYNENCIHWKEEVGALD